MKEKSVKTSKSLKDYENDCRFCFGFFLARFVWFFLVLRQFRSIFGLFCVVLIQSRVILAPFGSLWVNIGFLLDRLCLV